MTLSCLDVSTFENPPARKPHPVVTIGAPDSSPAMVAWVMVCHRVSLDECGQLSLHGVIDGLTVPELPIYVREITVVAKLDQAPLATELGPRLVILRPDALGRVAEEAYETELFVTGQYVMARVLGLPLVEQGIHHFELSVMGQAPRAVAVAVFADAREEERVH